MARKRIITIPEPKNAILADAHTILEYATEAVESLRAIYDAFTKTRGKGAPRTEEQDQLRAMIVFAGAGLDACLKQVVQSAMIEIVGKSPDAQKALVTFVERRLLRPSDKSGGGVNVSEIASMLLASSPRGAAIARLVQELTSRSLQSYEELRNLLGHLGMSDLRLDEAPLKKAFETRNRIVHEMDMDLEHRTRKRRARKRDEMVAQAKILLETAGNIIAKADELLG